MRVFSLAFLLSAVACGPEPHVLPVVADIASDQPLFATVSAIEVRSDQSYQVDAEVTNGFIIRIDSADNGWLDFPYCFVDTDLHGECVDEHGKTWIFDGPFYSEDMVSRDDP